MNQTKRSYPGLNVQHPISRLILNGSKSIETRTYPLPSQYIGKEMLLIETPGKEGKFKARIIGIAVFGESFKYKNKKDFYLDQQYHCVSPTSLWKWQPKKPKWGWPVLKIIKVPDEIPTLGRRGIIFTREIHFGKY